MREASSALVTATHGNAVMGVLFDVVNDCQKLLFLSRQCSKIFEKLLNFFSSKFEATPWSDNFSLHQSETGPGVAGNLFFTCLHNIFVVCFEGVCTSSWPA